MFHKTGQNFNIRNINAHICHQLADTLRHISFAGLCRYVMRWLREHYAESHDSTVPSTTPGERRCDILSRRKVSAHSLPKTFICLALFFFFGIVFVCFKRDMVESVEIMRDGIMRVEGGQSARTRAPLSLFLIPFLFVSGSKRELCVTFQIANCYLSPSFTYSLINSFYLLFIYWRNSYSGLYSVDIPLFFFLRLLV